MITIKKVIELFEIKKTGMKLDKNHTLLFHSPPLIQSGDRKGRMVGLNVRFCGNDSYLINLVKSVTGEQYDTISMSLSNEIARVELIRYNKIIHDTEFSILDISSASLDM